jgi:cytidine deaminase
MRAFMERTARSPPDPWFHRKSEKLVLAVLMVNVDGSPQFVPGINAEVSLPAGGSFCAERSAIVAARAQFPGISREDFAGIAVAEVPLLMDFPGKSGRSIEPYIVSNPLQPCGACSEWLRKLQDANAEFRVVTYSNIELDEIVECLPDGSRWDVTLEDDGAASARDGDGDSSAAVDELLSSGSAAKRSLTAIAKLSAHWPPGGKGFRRRDVVRRIPWFPVWWFDDLVKRGLIVSDAQGDPDKGTKYRVSETAIEFEEAAETAKLELEDAKEG